MKEQEIALKTKRSKKDKELIRTHYFRAKQPRSILDECNRESGQVYTELMVWYWRFHRRSGVWLSEGAISKWSDSLIAIRGRRIHSHSVDAAQQSFKKACETTHVVRKLGVDVNFPYRRKLFKTTVWKSDSIHIRDSYVLLSRGKGISPIKVSLPTFLVGREFKEVRLVYVQCKSHYEWHFVTNLGPMPEKKQKGSVVSIDPGEIHPITITDGQVSLVISCRELRSVYQGFVKKLGSLDSKRSKKTKGSRAMKRLNLAKEKARRRAGNKRRDLLHKISRAAVDFAESREAKTIAYGDVRKIADKSNRGKRVNQKLSLWPHGQLRQFITYKAAANGATVELQDEHFTSQSCPACKERNKARGRNYICRTCGFEGHRDGEVGVANIHSLKVHGEFGRVRVSTVKYRHPFLTGKRSRVDTAQVAGWINFSPEASASYGVEEGHQDVRIHSKPKELGRKAAEEPAEAIL